MNQWLFLPSRFYQAQYVRHIAYNAIINLISVRRGFRANEMPFFRIPTNGIRRSASRNKATLWNSNTTASNSDVFFAFRRVNENIMLALIFLPLPSNFLLTTLYRLASQSRFSRSRNNPPDATPPQKSTHAFPKIGSREFHPLYYTRTRREFRLGGKFSLSTFSTYLSLYQRLHRVLHPFS